MILNSSHNSFIDLILPFIIAVIILTMSHSGSHASTEQSWQGSYDVQKNDQDLRGREQQQDWEDEMEGKARTEGSTIIRPKASSFGPQLAARLLAVVSNVQFPFAPLIQVLSTLLKYVHSGRAPALGNVCRLAVLCALLRLPTATAAYELEKDDAVTGYGTIPIGTILVMATVFVWSVNDNMRGHRRSLRDRVLQKHSYMVWSITVLLAMSTILALAISDVHQLTALDPTTGVSCLGFAIVFAALVMYGRCRRCGHSPCICSTGSGGGGTASLAASVV